MTEIDTGEAVTDRTVSHSGTLALPEAAQDEREATCLWICIGAADALAQARRVCEFSVGGACAMKLASVTFDDQITEATATFSCPDGKTCGAAVGATVLFERMLDEPELQAPQAPTDC